MKRIRLLATIAALAAPSAAHAQLISVGLGAGTSVTSDGKTGSMHGTLSLELKPPLLPGVRGEAFMIDGGTVIEGRYAAVVSVVMSAPIPVITPYVIGGWGTYGIGGIDMKQGFNVGVGARASVVVGPALFVEVRRHEPLAKHLVTLGIRF